jgi:acetyl-CoA carboxylase carboxyltransferase component
MKKIPPMVVTPYEPPKKKKAIKPLNVEMAYRHKRCLQKLLDEGDISQTEFDALWAKTLARVKAGV